MFKNYSKDEIAEEITKLGRAYYDVSFKLMRYKLKTIAPYFLVITAGIIVGIGVGCLVYHKVTSDPMTFLRLLWR